VPVSFIANTGVFMVRTMFLVAVLLVALFGSTAFSLAQDAKPAAPQIEGNYVCQGENPGGKDGYKGLVEVSKKRDTYLVRWSIGKQVHEGTGILQGDSLSVVYSAPDGVGLAVYKIEKTQDGYKLAGQWTSHPGNGTILREWWTAAK